ncbi:calcium-binding protein, partial [Xanthomonas sacchari]
MAIVKGLPSSLKITAVGDKLSVKYTPNELKGVISTGVTYSTDGEIQISGGLNSGKSSVTVKGDVVRDSDGGYTVSGDSVTLSVKGPAGSQVGIVLTPGGFEPNPTDPMAPPIPSAKVELTVGTSVFSWKTTLDDNFTMDKLFDPESGGVLSNGLVGWWYGLLRHFDRELDEKLADAVGGNFQSSKGWRRSTDPLVLDLDGDGIETISASGKVLFDHEGNSVKEGTGWVSADDGILVFDRNGNGVIDEGSELFGDHTPGAELALGQTSEISAGLRALAALDKNGDGQFDSKDKDFKSVQVWRDLNQDGISQSGELFGLAELGISGISVTPVSTKNVSLNNGNTVDSYGSFTRSDGSQGIAADLLLASDAFHREFVDSVPLTESAGKVVNVAGSGLVRDLQEAVSLDEGIYKLIANISTDLSRGEALTIVESVLFAWANTSAMRSSVDYFNGQGGRERLAVYGTDAKGRAFDISQILSVMEKFNGELYFSGGSDGQPLRLGNSSWNAVDSGAGSSFNVVLGQEQTGLLLKGYDALKLQLYNGVVFDTRLSDYLDKLQVGFNEYAEIVFKMDGISSKLKETLLEEGNAAALEDLYDLREVSSSMPLTWSWVDTLLELDQIAVDHSDFQVRAGALMGVLFGNAVVGGGADDVIIGTEGNDSLSGANGNDTLIGGVGDDVLDGGLGTNRLEGGAGNDVLSVSTQSQNSVLIGGAGDDTLNGSWYSDTYVFNKGDGHDTVVETSYYSNTTDKLVFGEGLSADDVRILRDGYDVVLTFGDGTDSVRLKDWLNSAGGENDSARVEQFVFADGTIWTPETLKAKGLTTIGTEGDDVLTGWNGNDILLGGAGNDKLDGRDGTNRLEGGAGNDVLSVSTQSQNSVLIGGTGDDTLNGSWYSDTYIFNKGDGHDTVVETSYYSDTTDKLVFGEGLSADDVRILRDGYDVVLTFGDGTDSVRLKDWL